MIIKALADLFSSLRFLQQQPPHTHSLSRRPHRAAPRPLHLQRRNKRRKNLSIHKLPSNNHVARSLPSPLPGRPERLRRRPRRRLHGGPRRHLPLRRLQLQGVPEARRPDPVQGVRTPRAVQGADEEVSFLGLVLCAWFFGLFLLTLTVRGECAASCSCRWVGNGE